MEDILRTLVGFKSVTGNADETHRLLQYVADYLSERGMHIAWFEDRGFESLVATVKPGHKTPEVMLAAHVDVVPAPDELFTLRKENGRYLGRGVMDMKVAVAAYMKTVDELRGKLQDYDFGIMLTSDEENCGKDNISGTIYLINQGYIPKFVVLPDGGNDWQLETIANGFAQFSLEAHGKTAHSSRPWLGDNAAFRLLDALNDIKAHFKDQGPKTDTVNIGSVDITGPVNRVPDHASAEISVRPTRPGRLKHWQETFKAICAQHRVQLIERCGWDPVFNSMDNPYVKRFAELTEDVTGTKVGGFQSYGGSDARFFAELGIPYASAYPKGGNHHKDDEWLAEEALEQMGEIVSRYVREVAVSTPVGNVMETKATVAAAAN